MKLPLLEPIPPPYDALAWEKLPFPEKCRAGCESWALQGYGSPIGAVLLYALKVALYIAGWAFFVRFTPGLGELSRFGAWWSEPIAFQKAILWSMLFEVLGLGCGSGPLTGRYFPPVGGFLYFLRPGTTKRPIFEELPILGGSRRTVVDVLLYAALLVLLVRALIAPALGPAHYLPIAVLVPVLGVLDKTLFLAARAEHYWVTIVVFLFASDWIAGSKAVQLALWLGAGVSKLNAHFPAVVCVMISNSPVARFAWLRKRMYRAFPDDLRPSRLAVSMAHMGTALELAVPIVLALGSGGTTTTIGLVLMLVLHGFITSCVPMGVPIEWNFMVVYGGFFLFGHHADVTLLDVGSPWLAAFLVVMVIGLPLAGNFFPRAISFLLSMRYYAGNWAYSIWLFRGDSYRKLDRLTKSAPWLHDQLARFYDRRTAVGLVGKVLAFRAMHLHGRALQLLVPKAVARVEEYEWVDGELVAGLALGWNFGDGHLHDEGLLRAIQAQCGFEEGELRCIFVESQPLFGRTQAWRIADAKTGRITEGEVTIDALLALQPWPAGARRTIT
ncbi:DUF3556 domain-containing protein [Myxococcota bacterium]|nr:DUF3556 domain-containing protein [Myxococcota bacterium]